MPGTITARSGIVRRSFLAKSTRTVLSSTTTNWSLLSSEPAFICTVGKPPTDTERSSDHLTSLAVTGVPSWNLAHVFSEFGFELVAIVRQRAIRQCLGFMADQAIVAIPRRLVAGPIGADAVDVEIVGAAFGDDEKRLGAGVGLGGGPDRGCRHHRAGGNAGDGFQKIATLHVMRQTPAGNGFGGASQGLCQTLTEAQACFKRMIWLQY